MMASEQKENVELLTENQRGLVVSVANGNAVPKREQPTPPDGGLKAYSVALSSFLTNGLVFGIINSYSVIYIVLLDRLNKQNIENAEVKASLVGSLTIGTTFFLSALSGILASSFSLRLTAVVGGAIATVGMLLSSFFVDHAEVLCVTYGIIFGLGASLAYTPSLAILGQYFKKRLGVVNGLVTVGSSVFTLFMPTLMDFIIRKYSLEFLLRFLSVFTIGIALCGLMYTAPVTVLVEKPIKSDNSFKARLESVICVNMWKVTRYRLWALSMPVALIGYFVPYVHIKGHINVIFPEQENNNLPLQCIAITSAMGRILFGLMADRKRIDNILLQQISFYVIGTLTIILPFVRMFEFVIVIALGMGLFEGGFIALIGPIAFELVGTQYATQGIGCMLAMTSLPLSVGPTIAAAVYKVQKNYTLSFVLAGLSPIAGATLMFLIRFSKKSNTEPAVISNGHAIIIKEKDTEKAPMPLLAANDQVNHA